MNTPPTYRIESKQPSAPWDAHALGHAHHLASETEAQTIIAHLKTLGNDWAAVDYRIVEDRPNDWR